ncbi:MAG: 4-hydroxy-3-methylbut-2-enyl diphosphate reductase [Candidatus Omnitrophica bacterium]|nr:4-hydroxy-3-methylbut-2-enyl diphosphate reductase [Candidatus Omnitrophota bacterium]
MKINLAKSAGFCFGVKRALKIAKEIAKSPEQIYMSGDIVHNEKIVKELSRLGIKRIKHLPKKTRGIFLVRAHGEGKKTIERALALGYKVVDATCPMVKEIHRIAKTEEDKKRQVIVIGDRNHDEVLGIIGQLRQEAIVIDPKEKFLKKIKRIKDTPCSVVVQSTQNAEIVERIKSLLHAYIKDLRFFNTICNPTKTKQEEIKTLPKENDLVIVVGSKKSANTKRLYEIASSINKRTYWIENENQIKPYWLKEIDSVGITAGASTPEETIRNVVSCLKSFAKNNLES